MNQKVCSSGPGKYWQAAADYGIDVNQLEYLLSLPPLQRLERHEQARQLVLALKNAGQVYYGRQTPTPESTNRA